MLHGLPSPDLCRARDQNCWGAIFDQIPNFLCTIVGRHGILPFLLVLDKLSMLNVGLPICKNQEITTLLPEFGCTAFNGTYTYGPWGPCAFTPRTAM